MKKIKNSHQSSNPLPVPNSQHMDLNSVKKNIKLNSKKDSQLESFQKLVVLLLSPALPGLGNRVGFPDLLTRILHGGVRRRSRQRGRWKIVDAGKGHVGGIEEVEALSRAWVHRHHQDQTETSIESNRISLVFCNLNRIESVSVSCSQ